MSDPRVTIVIRPIADPPAAAQQIRDLLQRYAAQRRRQPPTAE